MTDTIDNVVETLAASATDIRGYLTDRRALDDENVSGETQLAADVKADELLADRMSAIDGVGEFASEERVDVVDCGSGYGVTVDPLDGSSNLESNNTMGTILGVYDAPLPARGTSLVAAAYVLYGPITTLMVARDSTVTEYLVDDELVVRRFNVTLPEEPVVYGFGGRVPDWPTDFTTFAREIESELKLRYGGAMVGDVNQMMFYGGIFSYPGLVSRPTGKLRLQFEANPVAYIVETAGGASSNGEQSLLDIEPTDLHQRVPVHVGNESLIERLDAALGDAEQ